MPSLADLRRAFFTAQLGKDPNAGLSDADLETLYLSGDALYTRSKMRTTDSSPKNNTTVTAVDSTLQFEAEANSVYLVEGIVVYSSAAAADFRWTVSAPAGATGGFTSTGPTATVGFNQDIGAAGALAGFGVETVTGGSGVGVYSFAEFRAYIVTTNAGTVGFKWAQWVANASDTVVHKGSILRHRKVA